MDEFKVLALKLDTFIGKKIKIMRSLRDLNQRDLGQRVGVTLQQIQKYERGVNRVSASRLFMIAQALNVDVGYFFEDYRDAARIASELSDRDSLIHKIRALVGE